jgi:hypothetical protein
MLTTDIKIKVHNMIDNMPDEVLKDLIPILEKIETNNISSIRMEMIKKIIADNHELLQKLAQ